TRGTSRGSRSRRSVSRDGHLRCPATRRGRGRRRLRFNLASVHLDVHASFEEFEAVNVKALERLVELCSVSGVRRLVQVSSVGVYGHVQSPPANETAPLNPQNDYERTKMAGEEAARRSAARTG